MTRPIVGDVAIGVSSRRAHRDEDAVIDTGGRFLCLIPWRDVTLVGTAHARYSGSADELEATEDDIQDLLDDVNDAYPDASLKRDEVRLVHRGLLPMAPGTSNGAGVTLQKSYRLDDRVDGLLSIVGVKYTTRARTLPKRRWTEPSRSSAGIRSRHARAPRPVLGGDIDSFDDLMAGAGGDAPRDVLEHLVYTYGSRYRDLLKGDCERVSPSTPVLASEVRRAVREEMAVDLASVVLRRTELGTAGHPWSDATLEACAAIVQSELGWDDARKTSELETMEELSIDNEASSEANAPRRCGRRFGPRGCSSACSSAFSSGLPLWYLWQLIPYWLRTEGIWARRAIGLSPSLLLFPYNWKVRHCTSARPLQSVPGLGRRRGWMLASQLGLVAAHRRHGLFQS